MNFALLWVVSSSHQEACTNTEIYLGCWGWGFLRRKEERCESFYRTLISLLCQLTSWREETFLSASKQIWIPPHPQTTNAGKPSLSPGFRGVLPIACVPLGCLLPLGLFGLDLSSALPVLACETLLPSNANMDWTCTCMIDKLIWQSGLRAEVLWSSSSCELKADLPKSPSLS